MKVYALIKRCEDNFYPDYTIVDDCVYLNEVDAKKRLEELIEENPHWPEQLGIYDFKVMK